MQGQQRTPLTSCASAVLRCCSVLAKQAELAEKIRDSAGAASYARHLQRTGKRLPDYLRRAVSEKV